MIRKDKKEQFLEEVSAYEGTLCAWVEAFREHVEGDEDNLVEEIVASIEKRIKRSANSPGVSVQALRADIERGLKRLRVIQPNVRIVLKNVAWESSRDEGFMAALREALPASDLVGWFDEFTAARAR